MSKKSLYRLPRKARYYSAKRLLAVDDYMGVFLT